MSPETIPVPQVLDPDRPASDASADSPSAADGSGGDVRTAALVATCAYATHLWHTLDDVRRYLVRSVDPGPDMAHGTRPDGPDDEEGWSHWQNVYATVTSVLAGPRGDSGFGVSEARREAQLRRSASPPAGASAAPTTPAAPTAPAGDESGDRHDEGTDGSPDTTTGGTESAPRSRPPLEAISLAALVIGVVAGRSWGQRSVRRSGAARS